MEYPTSFHSLCLVTFPYFMINGKYIWNPRGYTFLSRMTAASLQGLYGYVDCTWAMILIIYFWLFVIMLGFLTEKPSMNGFSKNVQGESRLAQRKISNMLEMFSITPGYMISFSPFPGGNSYIFALSERISRTLWGYIRHGTIGGISGNDLYCFTLG